MREAGAVEEETYYDSPEAFNKLLHVKIYIFQKGENNDHV